MVRIWTGEVWVRSTTPESSEPTQKVSWLDRAGWSGGMLSASKLNHSASTSGPSATSKPIATNRSAMRSVRVVSGCRAPAGDPVPGQRDVDGLLDEHPGVALGLELGLPGGQRLGDGAAGGAHPLAGLRLGGRRQRPDLAVGQGQGGPVAGVLEAGGLERVEVGRRGDGGQGGVAGLLDLVGVQGGHLHGVVGLVRCGHDRAPSGRGRPSLGSGGGGWTSGWPARRSRRPARRRSQSA